MGVTASEQPAAGHVVWDTEEWMTMGNDTAQALAHNDTLLRPLTPFTYTTVSEQVLVRLTFRWQDVHNS